MNLLLNFCRRNVPDVRECRVLPSKVIDKQPKKHLALSLSFPFFFTLKILASLSVFSHGLLLEHSGSRALRCMSPSKRHSLSRNRNDPGVFIPLVCYDYTRCITLNAGNHFRPPVARAPDPVNQSVWISFSPSVLRWPPSNAGEHIPSPVLSKHRSAIPGMANINLPVASHLLHVSSRPIMLRGAP